MLKILSFICTLWIAQQAAGAALALRCESQAGFKSRDKAIQASAEGRLETLAFGHSLLSASLQYHIDCQKGLSCWAEASQAGTPILANRNFKPTRYTGYSKYTSRPDEDSAASVHLLLPDFSLGQDTNQFTGYMQLSGIHGSYGATVPMLCKGTPVASRANDSLATAYEEIQNSNQVIQKDFGFSKLSLHADEVLLAKDIAQSQPHSVSLAKATQLALALVLDEYADGENPLNIAAMGWAETNGKILPVPLCQEQKLAAAQFLRQQMTEPKTSLSLYLGETIKGLIYPPEQGETQDQNWIFVLRIPTLSDHIYWVVVDKRGETPPYVYGFN